MNEQLDRLIGALEAEIEYVRKDSSSQSLHLLSGERISAERPLYVFVLEDPFRLPEEATGTLRVQNREIVASIVSQVGDRITLRVDDDLPDFVPRASLTVESVQLLVQLQNRLEEIRSRGAADSLLPTVFRLREPQIGWKEPPPHIKSELDDSKRDAVAQAMGSDISMLWGPPGTGKTYTIAALTAALFHEGEKVLVTSHTHAAVDQALWESILEDRGFLRSLAEEEEGRILKVGDLLQEKFPDFVRFDRIVDKKAAEMDAVIASAQQRLTALESRLGEAQRSMSVWQRKETLEKAIDHYLAEAATVSSSLRDINKTEPRFHQRLVETLESGVSAEEMALREAEEFVRAARSRLEKERESLEQAKHEHESAQRSRWPWKGGRVRTWHERVLASIEETGQAEVTLNQSNTDLEVRKSGLAQARSSAEEAREEPAKWLAHRWEFKPSNAGLTAATALEDIHKSRSDLEARARLHSTVISEAEQDLKSISSQLEGLPPKFTLERVMPDLERLNAECRLELDILMSRRASIAVEVLGGAQIVFATLTKFYMDPDLRGMAFDAVIIDESSMAMLPLVAFAATRASKRIVFVGDFYQLPPIVRSEEANEVLGQSVFDLWNIQDRIEKDVQIDELRTLTLQRRMHPEIANVARELAYKNRLKDHTTMHTREMPDWIKSALPSSSALLTVDISGLHPWSSRVPGSLSRFNFYSAEVSCEIAAAFAKQIDQPSSDEPPPIGIVTPYAEQRRLLTRLVKELGLDRWVVVGTVHTFQGNEAEVIIFDSVLSDPFWTAKFVTPRLTPEVLKDLNVAVTRAKRRFVFVGDFDWLRKRAGGTTAMGQLWSYLEANAESVNAEDVVSQDFLARVASAPGVATGWNIGEAPQHASFLSEQSFYPSFMGDIGSAKERVVLFTPFLGRNRWPRVEPAVRAAVERGVEVILIHKPLSDPEWRANRDFGKQILGRLRSFGVKLVGVSGIHAKTIVIDGIIVYEGSLNWASQTASKEHMWRFESAEMAAVIEKLYQLEPIVDAVSSPPSNASDKCPHCGSDLIVINQRELQHWDKQPIKFGCSAYAEDPARCKGYLRPVSARAPFTRIPTCAEGEPMTVTTTKSGRPGSWTCTHGRCKRVRWVNGDITPPVD